MRVRMLMTWNEAGTPWMKYGVRLEGRLSLRYEKRVQPGKPLAVTGEFEGSATRFTFWENIFLVERLPRSITPLGRYWLAPPGVPAAVEWPVDFGSILRSITPYSFNIPVTGALVGEDLQLRIEPARLDFTSVVSNRMLLVVFNGLTPDFKTFTFPIEKAGWIVLKGFGDDVRLQVESGADGNRWITDQRSNHRESPGRGVVVDWDIRLDTRLKSLKELPAPLQSVNRDRCRQLAIVQHRRVDRRQLRGERLACSRELRACALPVVRRCRGRQPAVQIRDAPGILTVAKHQHPPSLREVASGVREIARLKFGPRNFEQRACNLGMICGEARTQRPQTLGLCRERGRKIALRAQDLSLNHERRAEQRMVGIERLALDGERSLDVRLREVGATPIQLQQRELAQAVGVLGMLYAASRTPDLQRSCELAAGGIECAAIEQQRAQMEMRNCDVRMLRTENLRPGRDQPGIQRLGILVPSKAAISAGDVAERRQCIGVLRAGVTLPVREYALQDRQCLLVVGLLQHRAAEIVAGADRLRMGVTGDARVELTHFAKVFFGFGVAPAQTAAHRGC